MELNNLTHLNEKDGSCNDFVKEVSSDFLGWLFAKNKV